MHYDAVAALAAAIDDIGGEEQARSTAAQSAAKRRPVTKPVVAQLSILDTTSDTELDTTSDTVLDTNAEPRR